MSDLLLLDRLIAFRDALPAGEMQLPEVRVFWRLVEMYSHLERLPEGDPCAGMWSIGAMGDGIKQDIEDDLVAFMAEMQKVRAGHE